MLSTHVWCPFSHVLCPVYIFYALYTYFMSITCILWCPVHIFYDVQDTILWPVYIFYVHFTCFISSTQFCVQYTYFMMSRTYFMTSIRILCQFHMFYFQYTYCMMSSRHRLCPIHILCPVHILCAVHVLYVRYTFYDVQYTHFVSSTHNFVIAMQQSDPNAQNFSLYISFWTFCIFGRRLYCSVWIYSG
jgi:hypothetical protein